MKGVYKYLLLLLFVCTLSGCNNKQDNIDDKTDKNNVNINDNQISDETDDKDSKNDNNQVKDEDNVKIEKKGHTLSTSVGKFIVDKDGSVYYINSKLFSQSGVDYTFTDNDLSVLGTKNKYNNYTYQNDPTCSIDSGCIIESYKLDLINISSAYEVYFGNGSINTSIIFLSYDGLVHELKFEVNDAKMSITLKKDVSENKNIVSIVPNGSFGGNSAFLVDKNGNKYQYYSK